MKLEFSRAIIMNQGMPPYKGKKVVYYEDPRFKDKAFLKIPEMDCIKRQSNHIKRMDEPSIKKTIREIEGVNITRMFSGETDLFAI